MQTFGCFISKRHEMIEIIRLIKKNDCVKINNGTLNL